MNAQTVNSGLDFKESGFADVKLSPTLNRIGSKILKITAYFPMKNKRSDSDNENVFLGVNINQQVGDKWHNLTF
jgi:hypothetical protein